MKSKILCLLLLIPIFLVIITFATSNNLVLPFVPDVENLILEHESKEAVELNKPYTMCKLAFLGLGNVIFMGNFIRL